MHNYKQYKRTFTNNNKLHTNYPTDHLSLIAICFAYMMYATTLKLYNRMRMYVTKLF